MTKELIFKRIALDDGYVTDKSMFAVEDDRELVYKAMDEYAKQQTIAFDVWKRENKWFSFENNGYWYQIFEVGTSRSHKLTTEQLYNQFIEQQNK